MNKKNMKKVFSLILIAIMITVNITPAFAAITHYVVEKEGVKYQYDQKDLIESYYGDKKLYKDYLRGELKALLDDKNGYIDAEDVFRYIANTEKVYVNNYTESKEARVVEVGNVININKDGNPIEVAYVANDFTYGYMNFKPVMQSERQIFVVTGFSEKGMEKSQSNGDLVIPKIVEIEENGEYITKSVEGIDREAFKDIGLKSVVFPETIGEYDFVINTSAFANAGLEKVVFNEGIRAIKEGAFTNNNLTELYFPSTTLTIGNNSFAHNNISNLVFSDDVVAIQIDNYAFYDNELKEVHVPYSIFKFLGYVFKGNPGTVSLPESELDSNDPKGTGVVQIYTRNQVHLTSDTYIAISKYHNIVNVAEGIDRTELYSAIQNANSIVLSDYPHTNVEKFLTELSVVKNVFKDEEATQKHIDNSLASLINAINTLRKSGIDKSNLRILIKEAKGYSSQIYTTETYVVLESAIAEAEVLLLDPMAADEEIAIVEGKIRDAIDSLVIKSDIVFTKNDFTYEGNTIIGFSSTGEEKVKYNKNLILPDESPDEIIIEVIGKSAFQNVDPIWGSDTVTPVDGIETVKLPSQLKRIEDSAFKYNSLEEVNFPQTLEYIGSVAFNANLLKSVYLPDSVIELGEGAFSLNKITELRLSPNLTEIENGTFSRNIHLENVELNEGLTRIGKSAFIGAPIKSIEFPSTLKTIERMAFSATRLESVHIPSNVEVIETQAFKQNLKFRTLKEITFEEGLKSIGEGAFMDGMISEVHLPHSLEELGQAAFAGNINANKEPIIVKLYTTNEAHLNFETTKSKLHQQIILAVAPSTYALTFNVKDESGLVVEGATIQVKDSKGNVIEDLGAVERGEYRYTVSKEGYINARGTIVVADEDVSKDIILIAETVSEFVIDEDGVITKYTGNNVNLVIPSEIAGVPVKAIGKQVFAKKGIESVQIPEGVETIGTGSFIQNNLTTVTLPSTVKTIEALAFANNQSLVEINLNEGLETIGNQVFQNTPLTGATIIIPSTVMNIGNSAFKGQNIDQMIIKGDENSASIKFGVPIGDNGLNLKLESPKKNAELVWNSFGCADNNNYVGLGNIELTANTSEELKVALENNVNIKIVGIYKAVDSGMEDIRVVKAIPWDLSQVEMNQETIILNQKISLGNEYFPLMEGYIAPTLSLCKANNYYSIDVILSTEVEEVESDFVIDENGVITAYNGSQTELVIPNQVDGVIVTEIGDSVFDKKGLTSVEIPDTVITIGESAFRGNKLTSIRLPMSLETIKKGAFQGNTLGSLAVPSSVKTIGNTAFGRNKIEELSLPEGLKIIEDGAFQANSLTELTIPGSVEVVAAFAFAVNPNLSSVVLEEGIREISANAFTNNKALMGEIILPSTLEHLYTSAFKGTGVNSLYVKGDEDSSLIEIHSGISSGLEDIRFESPYKEAYIVFNVSTNVDVDLGTIDYSGEVDDLQTYLQENLLVKESAYHVNKQDRTGKSDIVILADIDWNLEDVDLSSESVVIYGTAKDFTVEDLQSKGEDLTPPNPSNSVSKNTYKIIINLVS